MANDKGIIGRVITDEKWKAFLESVFFTHDEPLIPSVQFIRVKPRQKPEDQVSEQQVLWLRDLAHRKGMGRDDFQKAIEDSRLSHFLDVLKLAQMGLTVPTGARICVLRAKVEHGREWQEAVNATGPDTPSTRDIRKMGDLYPPISTEKVEEDLILLNYPSCVRDMEKALTWCNEKKLERTVPREVFAVGEQYPNLHEHIVPNPISIVATTECSLKGCQYVCHVWWDGIGRGADIDRVIRFYGQCDWFLFRVPALKAK